jgi:uncharacterized repeat protein (TIGR03943 family)
MNRQTNRQVDWLGIVMLLSWCLFFVFLMVSGRMPLYVSPRFRFLPALGSALAFAMAFVLRYGRHVHGIRREMSLLSWLLMPVVLGVIVAPAGLGEVVAGKQHGDLLSSSQGNSSVFLNLAHDARYRSVTIKELVVAGHIEPGKVSVDGQFVGQSPGLAHGETLLAHYSMVCCAMDVRPMTVILRCPNNYKPEIGQWARVRGTVRRERRAVLIDAESIQPIAEPSPPYLY